jgi:cytochrome c-type biogenesis protein CcmH/NrfG
LRLDFKNAVQLDPKFAKGCHMLGMTELSFGKFKAAYGALLKAAELSPD